MKDASLDRDRAKVLFSGIQIGLPNGQAVSQGQWPHIIMIMNICRNHSLSPKNGSKCLKLVKMGLKKWNTNFRLESFHREKITALTYSVFSDIFHLNKLKVVFHLLFNFWAMVNNHHIYLSSIYFIIIFLSIYFHTIFRQGNIPLRE